MSNVKDFMDQMKEYDWSKGAIGIGNKIKVEMITQLEVDRLSKYVSNGCPDCKSYRLQITFQDTSVGQVVIVCCDDCSFADNITDFGCW